MRRFLPSFLAAGLVLAATALPARASWLSEYLHRRYDPYYYGPAYGSYYPPDYGYYDPAYGQYYDYPPQLAYPPPTVYYYSPAPYYGPSWYGRDYRRGDW